MVFFGTFLFTKKERYSCREHETPHPAPAGATPACPRAKEVLKRSFKRLSFSHFFLRRKKCGRRRPPPRQGKANSPPRRRNPPRAKGLLNRRSKWFSLVPFFLQKKKGTRAGARNAPACARRRSTCSPPGQRNSANPVEANTPTVAGASGRGSLRAGERRHSPFDRQ